MQFFVQGAGASFRRTQRASPSTWRNVPGLTYQLGNLITRMRRNGRQPTPPRVPATAPGADYGHAMVIIMLGVFAAVFILTAIGGTPRHLVHGNGASGVTDAELGLHQRCDARAAARAASASRNSARVRREDVFDVRAISVRTA